VGLHTTCGTNNITIKSSHNFGSAESPALLYPNSPPPPFAHHYSSPPAPWEAASNLFWAIRTEGRKRRCRSRWNTSMPRQSSKSKREPNTKQNGNNKAWSSSPMDPVRRKAPPDTRSCGRRTRRGRDSNSTWVAHRKRTVRNAQPSPVPLRRQPADGQTRPPNHIYGRSGGHMEDDLGRPWTKTAIRHRGKKNTSPNSAARSQGSGSKYDGAPATAGLKATRAPTS